MSGRIEKVLKWAVVRKGGHPDFSVQYIWLRPFGRYIQNPTEFLGTTKLEFTSFLPVFLKNRPTNKSKKDGKISSNIDQNWVEDTVKTTRNSHFPSLALHPLFISGGGGQPVAQ